MNSFSRHIITLMLVCSLMALTACSAIRKAAVNRLKDIELTSFAVEKISPEGLKAMDASFYVGVHNPVGRLKFTDVTVTLFFGDSELGRFVFDPFTIEGHRDGVYLLMGHGDLKSGTALLRIIGALGGSDEGLMVQISATGRGYGVRGSLSKSMPLKEFLDMVKG